MNRNFYTEWLKTEIKFAEKFMENCKLAIADSDRQRLVINCDNLETARSCIKQAIKGIVGCQQSEQLIINGEPELIERARCLLDDIEAVAELIRRG